MPPKSKPAVMKTSSVMPTSLGQLRDQMLKRYGDRIVRRDDVIAYEVIPTGSLSLDFATKVGGWVRGRTHEIVGPEGAGKTTLVIQSMVAAQKKYPELSVGFIDMEQTFDWEWARKNGLDTSDERFMYVLPDDSEDVSDQLRMMCRTGLFSVVAVDSIGGMESKQAMTKEAEEAVMGRNAQVITRMVKIVAVQARANKVCVLFVNQYRANLSNPMGGDESAGPKAFKYSTTMRVVLRRTAEKALEEKIAGDTVAVGVEMAARVTRNKVAAPGNVGKFWIFNQPTSHFAGVGIDQSREYLDVGILCGVIEQGGGGYYTLPDGERLRGREAVQERVDADPVMREVLRTKIMETTAADVVHSASVTYDEAASDVDEAALDSDDE